MELHLISTGLQTKDRLIEILKTVHMYADYIHLRERRWHALDFVEVVSRLTEMGIQQRRIIINDRIDVAAATGVGGIQLASHSLDIAFVKQHHPELKIGCSVHSKEEAIQKEIAGADYCVYGHIFPTTSKHNMAPKGLARLREVVQAVSIPVIAIGGIQPENITSVKRTGVDGIAVLSGIFLAKDITVAAQNYQHFMRG